MGCISLKHMENDGSLFTHTENIMAVNCFLPVERFSCYLTRVTFGQVIPVGEGVLDFSRMEEAINAINRVAADADNAEAEVFR